MIINGRIGTVLKKKLMMFLTSIFSIVLIFSFPFWFFRKGANWILGKSNGV